MVYYVALVYYIKVDIFTPCKMVLSIIKNKKIKHVVYYIVLIYHLKLRFGTRIKSKIITVSE